MTPHAAALHLSHGDRVSLTTNHHRQPETGEGEEGEGCGFGSRVEWAAACRMLIARCSTTNGRRVRPSRGPDQVRRPRARVLQRDSIRGRSIAGCQEIGRGGCVVEGDRVPAGVVQDLPVGIWNLNENCPGW